MSSLLLTGVFVLATALSGCSHSAPNAIATPAADQFSMGQVRYVETGGSDRNDGTINRSWATLQHAADKANPGDTIIIRNGVYPQTLLIKRGGLPGAPITFKAESKWGARLSPNSTPNLYTIAIAVGVDHVIIQDLDITGRPETNWGIKVNGNHTKILGNKLHDIGNNMNECVAGAAVLVGGNYANNDTEINGNTIYNIGPPRSASFRCNKMHGIYLTNRGGLVTNNNIAQVWQGFGIHLYGEVSNWMITRNTVVDSGDRGHNTGGAYYISCGPNPVTCDNITVAKNVFENTQNSCVWQDPGPGRLGPRIAYVDNIVRNCSPNYW